MNCTSCGTALTPTAKFCHKCGARVGVRQQATWQIGLPWGVAGAALGALVAVLAMRGGDPGAAPPESGGGSDEPAPTSRSALPAPDISQMSPEERATRLFNRVMILAEAGKQDSVLFFLPMAIGAYSQLPAIDVDGRYHLGLLYLQGGDPAGALAQADTIRKTIPTHLFGFVLRARALQARNDVPGARAALHDFLKNEKVERGRRRPEYDEHRNVLDQFHQEAVQRTGGAARTGT